ncbi:hypothetical protein OUZ56_011338 [Daphnia magna]|uniref:Uncharacterized protein n=1 Tax=Daphnia magna TaxID=35525 RepID=A0ABQ9Z084_9CRUS|nr:hypothetical protein OUZ56_011338 [Daphnia magna]
MKLWNSSAAGDGVVMMPLLMPRDLKRIKDLVGLYQNRIKVLVFPLVLRADHLPFIMKCASPFHIVAGKALFLYVQNSLEALTSLLVVYYAFDLQGGNDVLAFLLVIESEILELNTEKSRSCNAIHLLRNLLG